MNSVSSIQPVSKVQSQEKFWRDVCKKYGPRSYGSQLSSWISSSHYNRRLDHDIETPRTPKELAEIRARQHKTELENRWTELTGFKLRDVYITKPK